MTKSLYKLRDIKMMDCDETTNGKDFCDDYNRFYEIWLSAGGFFLEINVNLTKEDINKVFVEDLKNISKNPRNKINEQNLHCEFQKRFSQRNFGTESLSIYSIEY